MARRAEIVLLILDARQGAPAFTGRVAAPPSRRDDEVPRRVGRVQRRAERRRAENDARARVDGVVDEAEPPLPPAAKKPRCGRFDEGGAARRELRDRPQAERLRDELRHFAGRERVGEAEASRRRARRVERRAVERREHRGGIDAAGAVGDARQREL